MLRATLRLTVLCLLVASASVGYWYFHGPQSPAVRIQKLEDEKRELEQIVHRLTDEQRMAEVLVTDVRPSPTGGAAETSLIFMEYARDGRPLPPKSFTVRGDTVYVAGLSIRFVDDFVMKNDPLRGRGIMLFTKLFGSDQPPATAAEIDAPGIVPDAYRDGEPTAKSRVTEFEATLWRNVWRLVDDKTYREEKGVEVAGGKAVWFKAQTDRLYRITVDARGNPTVDWEPIKPIYREAMKKGITAGNAH